MVEESILVNNFLHIDGGRSQVHHMPVPTCYEVFKTSLEEDIGTCLQ
jgi:hypothetical protein